MCILSATSILKILLPERQINKKIYNSFDLMLNNLSSESWINQYIYWELSLIKELGYEIDYSNSDESIQINEKSLKIPNLLLNKNINNDFNQEIKKALNFNKNLFIENFINPNRLSFPLFRNILEDYFS